MPSRSQRHLREVRGKDSAGRGPDIGVGAEVFVVLDAPYIEEPVTPKTRVVKDVAVVHPGKYSKPADLSYQWYADGTELTGETNTTLYTTNIADGALVTVMETATGQVSGTVVQTPSNTRIVAKVSSPNELTFEVPIFESKETGSPLYLLIGGGPSPHTFTAQLTVDVFKPVKDKAVIIREISKDSTAEGATNTLLAAAAERPIAGVSSITGEVGTITLTPDNASVHFSLAIAVY